MNVWPTQLMHICKVEIFYELYSVHSNYITNNSCTIIWWFEVWVAIIINEIDHKCKHIMKIWRKQIWAYSLDSFCSFSTLRWSFNAVERFLPLWTIKPLHGRHRGIIRLNRQATYRCHIFKSHWIWKKNTFYLFHRKGMITFYSFWKRRQFLK